MGRMMRNTAADRRVVELAGRQHGVVSTRQLHAAGLDGDAIATRATHGWLRRLHRGVYLVGSAPLPLTSEAAALLACGASAVLSDRSAAAVWELCPPTDDVVEVTARPTVRQREGITIHRRRLAPRDTTRREGLAVTTPARTLLDLAASGTRTDLDHALNEALVKRLVSAGALRSYVARHATSRGTAALRAILQHEPQITRSAAERRLQVLIRPTCG
jgi:predicted transcriptional regulator of viral defense system